jgi:pantothenate kinase
MSRDRITRSFYENNQKDFDTAFKKILEKAKTGDRTCVRLIGETYFSRADQDRHHEVLPFKLEASSFDDIQKTSQNILKHVADGTLSHTTATFCFDQLKVAASLLNSFKLSEKVEKMEAQIQQLSHQE